MSSVPLFTFVFDDGNDTDYLIAREVFLRHREPACIAVVTDWVGKNGRLTVSQLKEMQAAGFEILSHTKSHPALTALSDDMVEKELSESKSTLEGWGLIVKSIVYPYNKSNQTVEKVAEKYYRSGRGGGSMLNEDAAGRYELRSYSMKHDISRIKGIIDKAYAEKKWLIIYHHQIDIKAIMYDAGDFIPDEDVRFMPSGATGRYKKNILFWTYFIPLSGSPNKGDTVTGVLSGATGVISRVIYNEKQIIEEMLDYIHTEYPDMRIVTIDKGLDILDSKI